MLPYVGGSNQIGSVVWARFLNPGSAPRQTNHCRDARYQQRVSYKVAPMLPAPQPEHDGADECHALVR
jgi:hypothetical protein